MNKLIELNISLSGSELAAEFCGLNSVEQAAFFNAISKNAETWDNRFDIQMADVERTGLVTAGGRSIMRIIGQFADEPAHKL